MIGSDLDFYVFFSRFCFFEFYDVVRVWSEIVEVAIWYPVATPARGAVGIEGSASGCELSIAASADGGESAALDCGSVGVGLICFWIGFGLRGLFGCFGRVGGFGGNFVFCENEGRRFFGVRK